jgi:hypothetical protein
VMANRSNSSSITINVDRRGAADADIQVNKPPSHHPLHAAACAACGFVTGKRVVCMVESAV